eukprot:8936983-Alexandrium_andersonii.AAC.1
MEDRGLKEERGLAAGGGGRMAGRKVNDPSIRAATFKLRLATTRNEQLQPQALQSSLQRLLGTQPRCE